MIEFELGVETDLGLLRLLVPRDGRVPDLLYPAGFAPDTTVCDQWGGVAAMPLVDDTAELASVWAPMPVPAPLTGERGRSRLVAAPRRYAEAALGPVWPNIRGGDRRRGHRAGRAGARARARRPVR